MVGCAISCRQTHSESGENVRLPSKRAELRQVQDERAVACLGCQPGTQLAVVAAEAEHKRFERRAPAVAGASVGATREPGILTRARVGALVYSALAPRFDGTQHCWLRKQGSPQALCQPESADAKMLAPFLGGMPKAPRLRTAYIEYRSAAPAVPMPPPRRGRRATRPPTRHQRKAKRALCYQWHVSTGR